jgi:hypothetical protein
MGQTNVRYLRYECHGWCSNFPILALSLLFWQSVLAVLSWLSCPGLPALAVLSWLSCTGCPALAVLLWLSVLMVLSGSGCPISAVLFWLSWFIHRISCGKFTGIPRILDIGRNFNPISSIIADCISFTPISEVPISGSIRYRSSRISDRVVSTHLL